MAEPRRSAATDAPDRDSSDLKGARILVVEARFYEDIADALLAGATRALQEAGATFERVSVPGSLEVAPAIAIALDAAERSGRPYEGAVALGCVIRGETLHFEIVSQESARALLELSLEIRRLALRGVELRLHLCLLAAHLLVHLRARLLLQFLPLGVELVPSLIHDMRIAITRKARKTIACLIAHGCIEPPAAE